MATDQEHHHDMTRTSTASDPDTATDPVCGMTVEIDEDTRSAEYDGEVFHFCSENCETKFGKDPFYYASGNAQKTPAHGEAGTQWTCPMHPQILKDEPGSCPICGMALEPMLPSDEPSEELSDFTTRMWISAAAAVPLVILTMASGLPISIRLPQHSCPAFSPKRIETAKASGHITKLRL